MRAEVKQKFELYTELNFLFEYALILLLNEFKTS